MKHNMKKMLSLLLAVLMLLPIGLISVSARSNAPIVYVEGDKTIWRVDEEGNRYTLFEDGEYLNDFIDKVLPLLPKALLTDDWNEYSQAALDVFLPAFEGFAPNPDGSLPEGSFIDWSWNEATLRPDDYMGGRPVYRFQPDSRLSPMVIADQINEFVEAVKRKTGADKVILFSRCEGTALLSAYLYKYCEANDFVGVESVGYLNGTVNGVGYSDAVMTGNLSLPPDAVYRFMTHIDTYSVVDGLDNDLFDKLKTIIEMLHETYGLNVTAELLTRIYNKVKDSFFAPFLKAYFAICGSFIATVNEHYGDFVDYIFAEPGDTLRYANIISQADAFHNNVQVHLNDMLLAAKAKGVGVFIIAEYGTQQYPLSEDSELIGDYMLSVKSQSFGATTSKVDGTLADTYIRARTDAGYGKYISPDKQIDASTCLFPDNTWFIKNLIHDFPYQVDNMMATLAEDPGNTVESTQYGQFLQYDKDKPALYPMEEVNDNDMSWENEDPGSGTRDFLQMVRDFLSRVIQWFRSFIEGIIGHARG